MSVDEEPRGGGRHEAVSSTSERGRILLLRLVDTRKGAQRSARSGVGPRPEVGLWEEMKRLHLKRNHGIDS